MTLSDDAMRLYQDIFTEKVARGVVAHVVQPLVFRAMITHWDVPSVTDKVDEQRDEVHRAALIELDACLERIGGMFDGKRDECFKLPVIKNERFR